MQHIINLASKTTQAIKWFWGCSLRLIQWVFEDDDVLQDKCEWYDEE